LAFPDNNKRKENTMSSAGGSRFSTQVVLGIIIICVGVLLMLDNLNVVEVRSIFRFWPVLLILIGALRLFDRRSVTGRGWGITLIVIGAIFLVQELDIATLHFHDLWPLLLILVGGSILWGSTMRRNMSSGDADAGATSLLNGTAVLGGFKSSSSAQDFRGGELTAIMGGCEVDLTRAAIKGEEAVIHVFAMWGGISLKVPPTWHIVIKGVPILGGFSDETRPVNDPSAKRLVVTGTAIMGGMDIKN
jgi:predicted membrane protein